MGKTITIEIPEAEAHETQAEIERLLSEIAASRSRVERDQEEINQIKAGTQANLEWLKNFKIAP